MNLSPETTTQEEAQQIWDQLDRDDASGLPPQPHREPERETHLQDHQASEPADAAPAELHNDEVSADAQAQLTASPEVQALLDRIAGLELGLQQQSHRLRQAEGHIGGLNSQIRQQLQVAQRVTETGGAAPTAQQIADAQKSPQALARLKDDYPEFGSAVEDALNAQMAQIEQRLKGFAPQQQQPEPGPRALNESDIERLRAELQVEVRHSDWKSTVREPVFVGWLSRQAPEVQLLAGSDNPRDAIRLLDIYSDARSTTTQRTQRLASAAAMPNGRQARGTQQKPVDEMTDQEYWRYLDEQDAAKSAAQGR